jgi:hypothetical protein
MRLVLVGVLVAPSAAFAQRLEYETPRHFAVDLRVGPYRPDVDSEAGLSGAPYRDTFGDGHLVYSGFGVEWEALVTKPLSLGVGAGAAFFQAYAKARFENCTVECTSSEYTVLNVIPFFAEATLRVDALPNWTRIPLTPFARAGLDRWLWWVLSGEGTAKADGKKGDGWTNGWHVAGGLALLLDFFEPSSATKLDQQTGINNSYLFAELVLTSIDGFGGGGSLVLSDTTWDAGLSLEF